MKYLLSTPEVASFETFHLVNARPVFELGADDDLAASGARCRM